MEIKIKELPEGVRESFMYMAQYLLSELEMYSLQVELWPAPEKRHEGHMIRVATGTNPYWWSELYKSYPGSKLDRQRFMDALKRIVRSLDTDTKYDSYVREQIKFFCINGLYGEAPDQAVIEYCEGDEYGHLTNNYGVL